MLWYILYDVLYFSHFVPYVQSYKVSDYTANVNSHTRHGGNDAKLTPYVYNCNDISILVDRLMSALPHTNILL